MKAGWEIKKVKDICEKASSNIAQNKIAEIDGDYPVYGASGFVQNVDFFHRDTPYIGIVKDGAGVGRINTYPAYSSLLGTLQYILPKDGYLLEYVAYALKSLDLSSFSSGATIPHIYFKDYGESTILVAPLPEQERIVSELDLISGVIEKKKQQLKELDSLAQSIFYEMFGSVDDNFNNLKIAPLSDVFSVIKDGTHQTPQYVDEKNGVKFLSAKDVVSGVIDWSNIKYIPFDLHEELHKRVAPKRNDILLCKNGTYGICSLVETDEIFDIYVSLALLRPNVGYIPKYLVYAINNPITKLQFDKSIKGIGVPNLHLGEIKKTMIIIPPFLLQQQFAEKIEVIEKQKELIKQSIKETETLFNGRMEYYFNS
ncbi:MAG: restriction endonuclease subunit S [Bacteroidales bacterium]|nr:restriction endonuclease subunit S [Bacteroidales bacterium]